MCLDQLVLYRVFQQRKKKRSFMWLAYLHRIIIQDMYVQGKERRNYKFYESQLLQELLTLPKHLSSPSVFSGFRVTRSLVLCVCFVDHCLSFCTFSFGHCVVCSSLIYGFWLPPFGVFKLFLQNYDRLQQHGWEDKILWYGLIIYVYWVLDLRMQL